jgi:hypothetical protein
MFVNRIGRAQAWGVENLVLQRSLFAQLLFQGNHLWGVSAPRWACPIGSEVWLARNTNILRWPLPGRACHRVGRARRGLVVGSRQSTHVDRKAIAETMEAQPCAACHRNVSPIARY